MSRSWIIDAKPGTNAYYVGAADFMAWVKKQCLEDGLDGLILCPCQ